jgi:hypothetical protein
VGELLGSGRGDGEARRRSFSAGCLWGLDGTSKSTRCVAMPRSVIFRAGTLAAMLLASLDDLSLSLSYV